MDAKFNDVCEYLDRLKARIMDTTSKVLITGDVNAGKSTLVNSLLKKVVLPTDQQPCTLAFCEVVNASKNRGREEIHVANIADVYEIDDESTYRRFSLEEVEKTVTSEENEGLIAVKIYCNSEQGPQSILHNDAVDIVLIDSPGLNCDSFKTMSLYAKQEDIDIVVFVVNAANHLTLSVHSPRWLHVS